MQGYEQLKTSLERAGKAVVLNGEYFNSIARQMALEIQEREERELKKAFGIDDEEQVSDALQALQKLSDSLREPFQKLSEIFEQIEEINELGPPPTEIKRRLKYAKNPMEIKQLNRQLAVAYKKYKSVGTAKERSRK